MAEQQVSHISALNIPKIIGEGSFDTKYILTELFKSLHVGDKPLGQAEMDTLGKLTKIDGTFAPYKEKIEAAAEDTNNIAYLSATLDTGLDKIKNLRGSNTIDVSPFSARHENLKKMLEDIKKDESKLDADYGKWSAAFQQKVKEIFAETGKPFPPEEVKRILTDFIQQTVVFISQYNAFMQKQLFLSRDFKTLHHDIYEKMPLAVRGSLPSPDQVNERGGLHI